MTYRHAADLADTLAADARDEVASDRAGAFIPDDPRQPSYGAEEPGDAPAKPLGPDPWLPWTCQRCGDEDRSGMPETCGMCGWRNYG